MNPIPTWQPIPPSAIPKGGGLLAKANPTFGVITTVAPFFNKLVSGQIFSKTIGQIKDGFDCWGATWTPTRAKNELPEWFNQMAGVLANAFSIDDDQLQARVNQAFRQMYKVKTANTTLEGWLGWKYDTAKDCTKRGLEVLEEGTDNYMVQLEQTAKDSFAQLGYEATVSRKRIQLYRHGNRGKMFQKTVPQFTIRKKSILSDFGSSSGGGVGLLGMVGLGLLIKKMM